MLIMRLFRLRSADSGLSVGAGGSPLRSVFRAARGVSPGRDAGTELPRQEIFTGMLVYDTFTVFMRALLLLFVVLFVIFTRLTGIPDRDDAVDIYCLVLGATLGMCLMASANHC